MIIIHDYLLAIVFTIFAMICWGSWANIQKLIAHNWRFELLYWDLSLGIFIAGLIAAFTVGSMGSEGRGFLEDFNHAQWQSLLSAILGGALWNIGTLLLVAAIAVAGLSIAFPIGGGIAWILGIVLNYLLVAYTDPGKTQGSGWLLWSGVAIIIIAIFASGKAYGKLAGSNRKATGKGLLLSVLAGLVIATFYPVTVRSLDPQLVAGGSGNLTPYTALVFFSIGVLISTCLVNPFFMRQPVEGDPVTMSDYCKGSLLTHVLGMLGGAIWMLGMILSFMAVGAADPAVTYALSNAAPVVAMIWGVFVWKEFAGAPQGTNRLIAIMFGCYLSGLVLITLSNL